MVLDKGNLNDKMLIHKVLESFINDDNRRNTVLGEISRWWYLGSALWMTKACLS